MLAMAAGADFIKTSTGKIPLDILEEYAAYGKGNIRFEFNTPEENEDVQQEAQRLGIQPVQLQVIENDKMEVKRVLMGMVIPVSYTHLTLPTKRIV